MYKENNNMGISYCTQNILSQNYSLHPKKLNNEQYPSKCVRYDEDGILENSTYVNNLLVDEFRISIENTGVDDSWIVVKN